MLLQKKMYAIERSVRYDMIMMWYNNKIYGWPEASCD